MNINPDNKGWEILLPKMDAAKEDLRQYTDAVADDDRLAAWLAVVESGATEEEYEQIEEAFTERVEDLLDALSDSLCEKLLERRRRNLANGKPWTPEEDALLRDPDGHIDVDYAMLKTGRTEGAVRCRIRKLYGLWW